MRYVGTVYRPPSEASSLLIQATIGCPHNKCRFCGMYKGKRFMVRPTKDVLDDLDEARDRFGDHVRTLFFPDGNTIIVKTRNLLQILERAKTNFPRLERITVYGSARFINLKTDEELRELREAGLGRVHMGLESGDDETLKFLNKGVTGEESALAGQKVRRAGMELSAYYLVGIGGKSRIREHAEASARVLSRMAPDFIRLRTYYPVPQAPLFEDIESGRFELPDGHEAMRELEILISNLNCSTMIVSDHVSNYLNLSGRLPDDRDELLGEVRMAMDADPRLFRRRLAGL